MAKVLGDRAVAGGNAVEFVGRDTDKASALARTVGGGSTSASMEAAPSGDIVVLAVPWQNAVPVVQQYGAALDGKIIVDISNTFDLSDYGGRHVAAETSVAQQIAEVTGEEETGLLVMGLGRWGEKNYDFSLTVRKGTNAHV
jgi:predicted dinucleotide-binding enzyme